MYTIIHHTNASPNVWPYTVRKNGEWYANANSLLQALEYVAWGGSFAFVVRS